MSLLTCAYAVLHDSPHQAVNWLRSIYSFTYHRILLPHTKYVISTSSSPTSRNLLCIQLHERNKTLDFFYYCCYQTNPLACSAVLSKPFICIRTILKELNLLAIHELMHCAKGQILLRLPRPLLIQKPNLICIQFSNGNTQKQQQQQQKPHYSPCVCITFYTNISKHSPVPCLLFNKMVSVVA